MKYEYSRIYYTDDRRKLNYVICHTVMCESEIGCITYMPGVLCPGNKT